MDDITVEELVDLVDSEVQDAEGRIQKMFEWHYARGVMIAKWLLGAAASISVAVMVALFKGDVSANWWQSLLVVASLLTFFGYGGYRLYLLRQIHREFVAALKLYHRLSEISPFISKYRDAIED